VQRWRLADRAAAVAWLAHNPDLADPSDSEHEQRTLFQ
jgi:hypothetical protein